MLATMVAHSHDIAFLDLFTFLGLRGEAFLPTDCSAKPIFGG